MIMSHHALGFLQYLHHQKLCNRGISLIGRWKDHHVLVSEMEIINDGWLIKVSSDRHLFRKKRWNRYWFVLRHSAYHSGQVILEYYKDSNCHNLRGRIDLGQCEQLDSGLLLEKEDRTTNNGFDIRTGNKIYCLIAETELEMNKWVGCISSVCGLTLKVEDDHSTSIPSAEIIEPVTSPPLLPSADNDADTVSHKDSSPYILISECFTGKPLPDWPLSIDNTLNYSYPKRESFHLPFLDAQYDYPRSSSLQDKQDAPFSTNFVHELYQVPPPPRICEGNFCNKTYSYPNSSSSDDSHDMQTFEGVNLGNNIFMYNSGPAIYHDNSDIETVRKEALQLAQQLESLGIDDSGVENKKPDLPQNCADHCADKMCFQNNNVDLSAEMILPPPRPPKPPDLHRKKSENLIPVSKQNDVFDFAVHPKNTCTYVDDCQLVTKAGEIIDNHALQLQSDISPTLLDDMYDVPKPRSEDSLTILLTGNGTHSRARRNIHVYDNAPPAYTKSSLLMCETKLSTLTLDSESETSVNCLAEQLVVEHNTKDIDSTKKCYDSPPLVDRKLKPKRTMFENNVEKLGQVIIYPSGPKHCPTEDVYNCGETEQDKRNNDLDTTVEKPLFSKTNEIQYLDLNLDDSPSSKEVTKPDGSQLKRTTVYKTVDFLRTEAFNKMRQNLEAVYRSSH